MIEHEKREKVIQCNRCEYYEGVHNTEGHAPCSFWNIGGVMWNDYCSRFHDFQIGGEVGMADCVMFPDDWRDFLKDYSFVDSDEVYTNGSLLIPVFRVEQLIEHLTESQLHEQEPKVMMLGKAQGSEECWIEFINSCVRVADVSMSAEIIEGKNVSEIVTIGTN